MNLVLFFCIDILSLFGFVFEGEFGSGWLLKIFMACKVCLFDLLFSGREIVNKFVLISVRF